MTEDRRKRLRYRAWHRGTKESDLLVGSFVDAITPSLADEELNALEAFLVLDDQDLMDFYMGRREPPANVRDDPIFKAFLGHPAPLPDL